MKNKLLILLAIGTALLASCKPYRVDPIEKIEANETAFLIPLGDGTENQEKLESVNFLESKQVATKQIIIPQRWRDTGRAPWSGEWIPVMRVMTVDRTPVTRNWIYSPTSYPKDNSNSTRTFGVESKDSIGFSVGVNISAHIEEDDAATYLYYYRSTDLQNILDKNVRERVHTLLSQEFAKLTLQESKDQKVQVTDRVAKAVTEHFEKYGITITSIGLAEGLEFEQPEIQAAINAAYVAEMQVESAKQETKKQTEVNAKLLEEAKGQIAKRIELAEGQRREAEIFAQSAELRSKLVDLEIRELDAQTRNKWDGKLPVTSLGEGGAQPLLNLSK